MTPRYRVHVTDEAVIVERGEKLRVWFARQGDAWVRAHEHPDAEVDTATGESGGEACPPGTVWIRHVELMLESGAILLARVSEPEREELAPLEYLQRGRLGMKRKTNETYFRVVGNYRLERLAERPKIARSATERTESPSKPSAK